VALAKKADFLEFELSDAQQVAPGFSRTSALRHRASNFAEFLLKR
jgi:hypothetical protein